MNIISVVISFICMSTLCNAMDSSKLRKIASSESEMTSEFKHLTIDEYGHLGKLASDVFSEPKIAKHLFQSIIDLYPPTAHGRIRAGLDLASVAMTCKTNNAYLSDPEFCQELLAWDRTRNSMILKPELAGYFYTLAGMRRFLQSFNQQVQEETDSGTISFINILKLSIAQRNVEKAILTLSHELYTDPARAMFTKLMLMTAQSTEKLIQAIKAIDGNLKLFVPLQKAVASLCTARQNAAQALSDQKMKELITHGWNPVEQDCYQSYTTTQLSWLETKLLSIDPGCIIQPITMQLTNRGNDIVMTTCTNEPELYHRLNTHNNDTIGRALVFRYKGEQYVVMPATINEQKRLAMIFNLARPTDNTLACILDDSGYFTGSFELIGDHLLCIGIEQSHDGTARAFLVDCNLASEEIYKIDLPERHPAASSVIAVSQSGTLLLGNSASGARMEYDPISKKCTEFLSHLRLIHDYDHASTMEPMKVVEHN